MTTITLYQFPDCPFCAKVRAKLDEKGLKYEKVNVPRDRESSERKEIAEKSGVATVPVIHIDDKWMGESDEIVAYVNKNL
jgi:glutaredoxin 3